MLQCRGHYILSIRYKARVFENAYVPGTAILSISNESWLGDHQSHRLYDVIGLWGEYGVKPNVTGWEKKIVDWVGDTSAGYDYCPITKGQQVIYRLKFWNDYDEQFSLNGTQFYDILPEVFGFEWTRGTQGEDGAWSGGNIRIDYRGFETNDPNDEKWNVIMESGKQYMRRMKWDDDFIMTCNAESGIGYIYVTLDFPGDLSWDSYVMKFNDKMMDNSLNVNIYGNVWREDKVEHDLLADIVTRLQKGVYASGGEIIQENQTSNVYRGGEQSRITYENDDVLRRKIYYYITVFNDGSGNMYLNDIQDVLPPGFTPCISLLRPRKGRLMRDNGFIRDCAILRIISSRCFCKRMMKIRISSS